MKEIISVLEKEGLGPEQCSSEEVVRVLFTRQKELGEKLKEADDVLSSCKNGDPRPTIQVGPFSSDFFDQGMNSVAGT